jgi:hypothetical protein
LTAGTGRKLLEHLAHHIRQTLTIGKLLGEELTGVDLRLTVTFILVDVVTVISIPLVCHQRKTSYLYRVEKKPA